MQTVKSEGIVAGLYKGHAATLLREIPGNFFWYGVYETTCHLMIPKGGTKKDVGTSAHLLGGAMAGMSYWTAFYPADTVKSALQTNPDFAKKSFIQTLVGIYKNEGMNEENVTYKYSSTYMFPPRLLLFIILLMSNQYLLTQQSIFFFSLIHTRIVLLFGSIKKKG